MPSITLTVDATNAQRILTGVGRYLHLTNPDSTPRDATLAEVKDYLRTHLGAVVRESDLATARQQAEQSTTPVTVT